MSHDELPKVIDKSQADIDAAIGAIKASEIEGGTKDFAISCIKLAVWLPKALLEHKIKVSNLRKLIFGLGRKNKKKEKNAAQSNTTNDVGTRSNLEPIQTEIPSSPPTTINEIAKSKSAYRIQPIEYRGFKYRIEKGLSQQPISIRYLNPLLSQYAISVDNN